MSKSKSNKLKDRRFFLANNVNSMIALYVPNKKDYREEYEVVMRDCNRQIHWCFTNDKRGLAKVRKVVALFTDLQKDIERSLANE